MVIFLHCSRKSYYRVKIDEITPQPFRVRGKKMELAMGLEPATCGLRYRCSAIELRQLKIDYLA